MPPDESRQRFEEFYAAQKASILGYVLRRISNPDDAADVVAEIFLTAWRRLPDVPPGEEARLWLYGVARRTLANHRRVERRRFTLTGELAVRLRLELAEHRPVRQPDDLAGVAAAFRELRDTDRELLSLVGWEGLDHGQIASVLGCSRNAVRIRLHRARRRLARALERQEPHSHPIATPARVTKGEHA